MCHRPGLGANESVSSPFSHPTKDSRRAGEGRGWASLTKIHSSPLSYPAALGLEVTHGRPATRHAGLSQRHVTRGPSADVLRASLLKERADPAAAAGTAERRLSPRPRRAPFRRPASSARWLWGSAPASLRPAVPRSSMTTPGAQAESWHLRESAPVSPLLCLVSDAPSSAASLACGFALVR